MADLATAGTLGDRATVTANFRDQYYGLVGAVGDDVEGPPLVTSGAIDVAGCAWGRRPIRFAKQTYRAPRVDLARLSPALARWARRCLVPKVLVATQTRVLEAFADVAGDLLPGVPVVRVVPAARSERDVVRVAAVLTSPSASLYVAHRSVGSGLSATTMRVSQRVLAELPWPGGDLDAAVAALARGDIDACGREVDRAYGVVDDAQFAWWSAGRQRDQGA
jgi:hypothetical protein